MLMSSDFLVLHAYWISSAAKGKYRSQNQKPHIAARVNSLGDRRHPWFIALP